MQVTPYQIDLLHHCLGLSQSHRHACRNHFVAGTGHHDMPHLEKLEQAGLINRMPAPGFCDAADIVFSVTESGKKVAMDNLKPPKPPRKKSRYSEYLSADCGESFSEFICGVKAPKWESRGSYFGYTFEWRMYRNTRDHNYALCIDIQGQWCKTKKEAKASYKLALQQRKEQAAELQ